MSSSLYFEGPNPTADLGLFRPGPRGPEVLLITRSRQSAACPGLPAFPGGFVEAVAPKAPKHEAAETPEEASRRECLEETGLRPGLDIELLSAGVWEGHGRDPRDSPQRWTRSHLFCGWAPEGFGPDPKGLDDAEPGETDWFAVADLRGQTMAFDHGRMLSSCCAKLGIEDPGALSWADGA